VREEETSDEAFDREAFVARALSLVAPRATVVAFHTGSRRVHVEVGPTWRGPEGARWAFVACPPNASRRAIALGVASLAREDRRPFALELLLEESGAHDAE
jgi:hypothetical protein